MIVAGGENEKHKLFYFARMLWATPQFLNASEPFSMEIGLLSMKQSENDLTSQHPRQNRVSARNGSPRVDSKWVTLKF